MNDKRFSFIVLFACKIKIIEQFAKIILTGLKHLWCFKKFWSILIVVCCTKNYPLSGLYPLFSIPKKNMSFQEQIKFPKFCVLSRIWRDGHGQEASNSKCNILPHCVVYYLHSSGIWFPSHIHHIEDCTCTCLYSLHECPCLWILCLCYCYLVEFYTSCSGCMTILVFIIWPTIHWTITGNMKHKDIQKWILE
jgi:hypothetical protein